MSSSSFLNRSHEVMATSPSVTTNNLNIRFLIPFEITINNYEGKMLLHDKEKASFPLFCV